MQTLEQALLDQLVAQYDAPDVTAITLAGSFARGAATRYSDVDLLRFVRDDDARGYQLAYHGERLVSLTTTTIAYEAVKLTQPDRAIWGVPTLQRMQILLDRAGEAARLQREAQAFDWSALKAEADRLAASELVGSIEECHKIMGALSRARESALVYATQGVVFGMVKVMALICGRLIASENSYFEEVASAVGNQSRWAQQLRTTLGLGKPSTAATRGRAALMLYVETARLVDETLQPEQRTLVETCITLMDEHTIGE